MTLIEIAKIPQAKREAPLAIVAFDMERAHFIAAVNKLLNEPDLKKADVSLELETCVAVLRQLAHFAQVKLGG
jgi:hypothetical protein